MERMVVTREVMARLLAEAEKARPSEACGLLFGRGARIEQAVPARNVHPDPQRHFEIDPQALIDAHRDARGGGPQVLGYYHSHPAGPAEPSATDREQAAGEGCVWAIAGGERVRFWRDEATGFVELPTSISSR